MSLSNICSRGCEMSMASLSIDTVNTCTASVSHSATTGSLTKGKKMTHQLQELRALHLQRVGDRFGCDGEQDLVGLILRGFHVPAEQSCVCKNVETRRHNAYRVHTDRGRSLFTVQPRTVQPRL